MAINSPNTGTPDTDWDGTLEDFDELDNNRFAMEWKLRYMYYRTQMLPDIGRWMRLLRFFHPRTLVDHWQDSFGNPLPKLYFSEGLSVEIYNWCRPIIEVYGSLLAGQKPLPFDIDIPPIDVEDPVQRFLADAQEKIIRSELYSQRIPMHFLDFCTSVVLFGIGYVYSWIDTEDRRLHTQAISWPGDVLPQWGSDRYGRGDEALESCILTERMPIDAAQRLYPDTHFQASMIDLSMRPDGRSQEFFQVGSTQILKVWWRWREETRKTNKRGKEHIGYAEIAYDGTQDGQPAVLYREDDTKYPDIPVRWATKFQTPGEAPHRGAGVLDDVVGINTEYNERFSALSDMLMRLVYPKYKAKGFTALNAPRFAEYSNTIPMGLNQDLIPIVEQINPAAFDAWLGRAETMILTSSGLSRLIMGSLPPGSQTSGEAMQNMLHASISRLEVIRTPIQWAWQSLFTDIWVPLLIKYGKHKAYDDKSDKNVTYKLAPLFVGFNRVDWIWPDVTPRDAIKTAELAMNLGRGGWLSDESVMKRTGSQSALDEIEKIRKERQDIIMHPDRVSATVQAETSLRMMAMSSGMKNTTTRLTLTGKMTPEAQQSEEARLGLIGQQQGAPTSLSQVASQTQQPPIGQMPTNPQELQQMLAQLQNTQRTNLAAQTPKLGQASNSTPAGQAPMLPPAAVPGQPVAPNLPPVPPGQPQQPMR